MHSIKKITRDMTKQDGDNEKVTNRENHCSRPGHAFRDFPLLSLLHGSNPFRQLDLLNYRQFSQHRRVNLTVIDNCMRFRIKVIRGCSYRVAVCRTWRDSRSYARIEDVLGNLDVADIGPLDGCNGVWRCTLIHPGDSGTNFHLRIQGLTAGGANK